MTLGRMTLGSVTLATAALLLVAPRASAQGRIEREAFTWAGTIREGRWIMVKNLRGSIEVSRGGDKVEVIATRRTRRGDADYVRFEVQKFGASEENVLICALWGDNSDCDEENYRSRSDRRSRDNDIVVDFSVRLPRGVKVSVQTANGDVRVEDAAAEVDASGVNGNVIVSTVGGPINARTVNGYVRATMGRFDLNSDLRFSSVNGSVAVEFTGDINADVELQTQNGRFVTDFPITITGRIDPRRLRATLGKGGPRLRLTTINGNVELRKR
jgi:hypothetical protein